MAGQVRVRGQNGSSHLVSVPDGKNSNPNLYLINLNIIRQSGNGFEQVITDTNFLVTILSYENNRSYWRGKNEDKEQDKSPEIASNQVVHRWLLKITRRKEAYTRYTDTVSSVVLCCVSALTTYTYTLICCPLLLQQQQQHFLVPSMASHVALLRAPPPLSISTQRFHAKQISINGLKFTSSSSCFPCSITTQRGSCSSVITCSSSNDRDPNSVDDEDVKQVERILEDKRRAALSAKIASGEFTVRQKSVYA